MNRCFADTHCQAIKGSEVASLLGSSLPSGKWAVLEWAGDKGAEQPSRSYG